VAPHCLQYTSHARRAEFLHFYPLLLSHRFLQVL
jgi:hypothetical protein